MYPLFSSSDAACDHDELALIGITALIEIRRVHRRTFSPGESFEPAKRVPLLHGAGAAWQAYQVVASRVNRLFTEVLT
jgi:hypothetical protein